jgi:cytochrome c2
VSRLVIAVAALAAVTLACRDASRAEREAAAMTGGDPRRGRALVRTYGCGTCHEIPGVPGATATVGPSLAGLSARSFLAGRLAHTPENLVRWIRHPREVDPATAMPELGIPEQDGRDLAAYLETLLP